MCKFEEKNEVQLRYSLRRGGGVGGFKKYTEDRRQEIRKH